MALIGLIGRMVLIRLIGLIGPTRVGLTRLGVMGLVGLMRFAWPTKAHRAYGAHEAQRAHEGHGALRPRKGSRRSEGSWGTQGSEGSPVKFKIMGPAGLIGPHKLRWPSGPMRPTRQAGPMEHMRLITRMSSVIPSGAWGSWSS
eukprot:367086-Pyramimonas_sp.AAC.1